MKGLVLKDLYSVKLQLLGGLALMLLPNIMMMISGGDLSGGESVEMIDFLSVVIYGVMNYISVTLCSSFLLNTPEYDEKSGWCKMQRAMPVTDGQIIGGKFIVMALVLGGLTVLSLICNITGVIFFNQPPEPLTAFPFIAALLQAIPLSLCFAAGYRTSSKYIMLIYLSIEIIIAAGVILLIVEAVNESVSETALRIISYAGIPVIAAAAISLGFIVGKKAVMKDF